MGLAALVLAGAVFARTAAAPQNTAAPTISGTAHQGSTLTAANGTWSNSPTSFSYQWQRCATDGSGCGDIVGATNQTYTLVAADVSHTVRVAVTATNADGKATANSAPTDVVASTNGPNNTVKPSVSGTATVGETLTVSNGTWTPTPSFYTRQWQQCAADGTSCTNITGATGSTYGVRSSDVGHTLRALVTAHTSGGEVATAVSNDSGVVAGASGSTTTATTTVTTPGHKVPTLAFLSLRRIGVRIYARFRICDSLSGRVRITERDIKARARPYTRHLAVTMSSGCHVFSRNWLLLSRFRSRGRFEVTLRATDRAGSVSRLAAKTIVFH